MTAKPQAVIYRGWVLKIVDSKNESRPYLISYVCEHLLNLQLLNSQSPQGSFQIGCCKRSVHSQELFLNIRVSSWLFTSIGADRSVRQSGLFIFFKLHRCIVFLCQRARYCCIKGNSKLCQIKLTDQVIV